MNELQRMRLPALLGAMAVIGAGSGLALAQGPDDPAAVEATAHEVDCTSMPALSASEASRLRDCYDVDVVSAPADASELEIATAKADAICAAITDPAQQPDACALFATPDGEQP